MGPIVNAGLIIPLFAIAAPFIFVLLVIKIFAGSDKHHRRKNSSRQREENEELKEISRGLRDLNRRIDNLETIRKYKKDKE